MKKLVLKFIFSLVFIECIISCGKVTDLKTNNSAFSNFKVIATEEIKGSDTIVTCHISDVDFGKVVRLPFSHFLDSLKLIKLENREDALVGWGIVLTQDNFVAPTEITGPQKVFDINGKYIGQYGGHGDGPGEYFCDVSSLYIDEKNDRIYLSPKVYSGINEYSLSNGKFIKKIPYPYYNFVAISLINPVKKEIAVIQKERKDGDPQLWIQDFEGNPIWSLKYSFYPLEQNGNDWLYLSNREEGKMDISFLRYLQNGPDTLYRFIPAKRELKRLFTADFGENAPLHTYFNLPDYYVVQGFETSPGSGERFGDGKMILVDKKTLKGGFADIYNDYLGGIELNFYSGIMYDPKNFTCLLDPGDLIKKIEKRLKDENISEYDKKYLEELLENISPDDNDYIIIGNFK